MRSKHESILNQTHYLKGHIMDNVIIVNGADSQIAKLRANVVKAVTRAISAEREYSVALNAYFGEFAWFDIEAKDISDDAKLVHAEKKALFEELKKANHSNPSTVWARVRKYGKEEKQGKEEKPESDGGASEAGNAGNAARSPMVRNMEELVNLYKFNARQDSLPEKIRQAQVHIASALAALGVDISLIK